MPRATCPGLPASWINGWLAAVGATMLNSRIRLHWTADRTPVAVISAADVDPVAAIVTSWPDNALLTDLPIAEHWHGAGRLQRKVSVQDFAARARAARSHRHSWTLSSTMTDLCVDENGNVAHAPFDPSAPKGSTLSSRLLRIHEKVEPTIERLMDSLAGRAVRVQDNGLGFDLARLGAQADATSPWIDPVVEVLAFFGLAMLPVRGRGIDRQLSRSVDDLETQRGWLRDSGNRWERRFIWPAWRQPLDHAGIDALLDVWRPDNKAVWSRTGVHAAWQSVGFRTSNRADPTRAFGAERL